MDGYVIKTFTVEIFLLTAILAVLLYNSSLLSNSYFNFPILDRETYIQTIFILGICVLLSLNIDFGTVTTLNLFFNDYTAISSKTILFLSSIGVLICGQPYFVRKKINLFEFYIMILLAIFSLSFLLTSTDLLSLYLCIEMQSLCFYVLATFNRNSVFSTEAGLKYFVLSAFASSLFLFGASFLYGLTGTTNLIHYSMLFHDFNPTVFDLSLIIFGVLFILIALFFKINAVPFHFWSPDVYEGAPLNATIFFVLVPKFVYFVLIFRLFYLAFHSFFDQLNIIFLFLGVLSVLIGSILALKQRRLKKLLIYSSISHVGFMLLALSTGSTFGFVSIFYYIILYILTGFVTWGILSLYSAYSDKNTLYLTDFSSLVKTNPSLAFALAISFFSLAGVPPLIGFSMKYFIFTSAMTQQMYELSFLIIILSVIGSFYYLRFIKIIFFEKQENYNFIVPKDNFIYDFLYFLISLCFFVVLFGFFDPSIFLLFSYKIVLGLLTFLL